ncbi:TrmH family RNA methyltransferase [Silvimonas terrae]|uniref:TrmH family RNA methyltransferase n=1 Tax=Silvimonas terrae TaxID=300266 RepID=A0A840RAX1_9NEIS|nr:RNA methyltransferase [Silvimonas terrae]MBB5190057.1 TrmH family RNA methyltransferase [Silvimonas terrae]
MEVIHSPQNALYKLCHKLATHRRDRLKQKKTLLDGAHLVAAALDAGWVIEKLLITPDGAGNPEVAGLIKACDVPATVLEATLFKSLSELPSPTGVMALVSIPDSQTARQHGLCLLLDGVQDPGNVGSILRTAAAAGVDQVLLSDHCADLWSPKVLRAGMGAHFVLDLVERADLAQFADGFAGPVAALMLDDAQDLYAATLTGNLALVMGSEGQGVSADMAARATLRLTIPMHPGIESLNVGAAAAICLYERVRQARTA